jgi:hypothetical protein
MQVFLAGIIQGSLADPTIHAQGWRGPVTELLAAHLPEADVYDHFAKHPGGIDYDLPRIRATLAEGNAACAASEVVICWLPEASMGTANEMLLAHEAGRLVLTITPMAPNWVIRAYSDLIFADMAAFEAFVRAGGVQRALAEKGLA